MAFITGLAAGMGLMAIITGFHPRTVRPGGGSIVVDVAVAIDAQGLFFRVQLMGDKDNPYGLAVGLFSVGNRGVTAEAVVIHQLIAGGKSPGNDLAPVRGVTIYAGCSGRMYPRGKPHFLGILILMTGHAEKGIGGRKTNNSQAANGRNNQEDYDDQRPGAFGKIWKG